MRTTTPPELTIQKNANGYTVIEPNQDGSRMGKTTALNVFQSFDAMAGHLRREFGEDNVNTCSPKSYLEQSEIEKLARENGKLHCALEDTQKELARWKDLHDGAPIEIVERLKGFVKSIIAQQDRDEERAEAERKKRSENARKAGLARHAKSKPTKGKK